MSDSLNGENGGDEMPLVTEASAEGQTENISQEPNAIESQKNIPPPERIGLLLDAIEAEGVDGAPLRRDWYSSHISDVTTEIQKRCSSYWRQNVMTYTQEEAQKIPLNIRNLLLFASKLQDGYLSASLQARLFTTPIKPTPVETTELIIPTTKSLMDKGLVVRGVMRPVSERLRIVLDQFTSEEILPVLDLIRIGGQNTANTVIRLTQKGATVQEVVGLYQIREALADEETPNLTVLLNLANQFPELDPREPEMPVWESLWDAYRASRFKYFDWFAEHLIDVAQHHHLATVDAALHMEPVTASDPNMSLENED